MADLERLLSDRLAPAFTAVAGTPTDPVIRRSPHADFQADGALALARTLGRAPRDIAAEVLAHADLSGVATAAVAGPGFVNLTVDPGLLGAELAALVGDERLGVPATTDPEIVVIDYSGPNVAKEMHVGHMRTTIIGDAAVRLLDFLGDTVIRVNHLGDWGTPFGMLIEHLTDLGEDAGVAELSLGDLNAFYRAARTKFDSDPDFAERSRLRVLALQSGDATTRRLWRVLVDASARHFLDVYALLGTRLTADDFRGESAYNDMLAPIVAELDALGLVHTSEGALVVFPDGFTGRDGAPHPMIVRLRTGGYGYQTTDLAAIRYRLLDLNATRLLYVVGAEQKQHFAMVFQTAREAGWLVPPARATHLALGMVLGADGRKLASRSGAAIRLIDLLDEGIERADAIIREKNPDLDPQRRAAVARAVGIGAIKYADLSSDRIKGYPFDWDRMLATTGDTAAYLQYAHARIHSIFQRGGTGATPGAPVSITEPAEHALAVELLAFPAVIATVAGSLDFHVLTAYLQRLVGAFTKFYDRCPVLRSDGATRASRLALCDLTARTVALGLDLLGIEAPDRM